MEEEPPVNPPSEDVDDHTCSVCHDQMDMSDPKATWVLACNHSFHAMCLRKWVRYQHAGGQRLNGSVSRITCPCCRGSLFFHQNDNEGSSNEINPSPSLLRPVGFENTGPPPTSFRINQAELSDVRSTHRTIGRTETPRPSMDMDDEEEQIITPTEYYRGMFEAAAQAQSEEERNDLLRRIPDAYRTPAPNSNRLARLTRQVLQPRQAVRIGHTATFSLAHANPFVPTESSVPGLQAQRVPEGESGRYPSNRRDPSPFITQQPRASHVRGVLNAFRPTRTPLSRQPPLPSRQPLSSVRRSPFTWASENLPRDMSLARPVQQHVHTTGNDRYSFSLRDEHMANDGYSTTTDRYRSEWNPGPFLCNFDVPFLAGPTSSTEATVGSSPSEEVAASEEENLIDL